MLSNNVNHIIVNGESLPLGGRKLEKQLSGM